MPELVDQATEEILPALQAPLEGRLVPAPYNFIFTGEDAIRVSVHNSVTGVGVAIHYRLLRRDQTVHASAHQVTPSSDRTVSEFEFSIGEGYLLNVVTFAVSGSPKIGQTFVKVDVIRGRGAAATVLATILQDHVTERQSVTWPGSPVRSSMGDVPSPRFVTGTDPPVGTVWSETVPTGARWELLAATYDLTTDATVANRTPRVTILTGAVTIVDVGTPGVITASLTRPSWFVAGLPFGTQNSFNDRLVSLPAMFLLLAGQVIRANVDNGQAGDNLGAPTLLIREWLEAD
jgi:hypothetical protein